MRFGGLGNRMFQYMFALALKARVPDAEISGVELPEWGISTPAAPAQTARAFGWSGTTCRLPKSRGD